MPSPQNLRRRFSFAPLGLTLIPLYPRLAPWAAFLRRCEARYGRTPFPDILVSGTHSKHSTASMWELFQIKFSLKAGAHISHPNPPPILLFMTPETDLLIP